MRAVICEVWDQRVYIFVTGKRGTSGESVICEVWDQRVYVFVTGKRGTSGEAIRQLPNVHDS